MSHAILSPSSINRIIRCPASAKINAVAERKGSMAAARGTSTHEMVEALLKNRLDGISLKDYYLGRTVDVDGFSFDITQDDIDMAEIYVDYIGIEPSPEEYSCLKENASGHKTLQIALWNEKIEKTFYVDSDGADSSLFVTANFDNEIKIKCNRLDNLQINKTHIKLLKLEAEGAEPEIVEGAREILKKTEFVSADLGPERGINSLETYGPVTDLLYKNNFRLIKINTDRLSILYKNNSF